MFKTLKSAISLVDRATNAKMPTVKLPNVNVNMRRDDNSGFWIDFPGEGVVQYNNAMEAFDDMRRRFNDLGAAYDELADVFEDVRAECDVLHAALDERDDRIKRLEGVCESYKRLVAER